MPAPLTDRTRTILLGSLALSLGIVVGAAIPDADPTRDDALATLGGAIAAGSAVGPEQTLDTVEYHRSVRAARNADPTLVDLLSAPCAPGATVVTGVNVPLGSTVGAVSPVGPGSWVVEGVTTVPSDDALWVEVTARNTGSNARRFVAMVEVTQP